MKFYHIYNILRVSEKMKKQTDNSKMRLKFSKFLKKSQDPKVKFKKPINNYSNLFPKDAMFWNIRGQKSQFHCNA